jgi:hypothetical protein
LRFSGLILENIFMVFLGSSCGETAKNAIKKSMGKDERKKDFVSQLFRPVKCFRNACQKPTYLIYHLPDIRRFHFFSSSAPLGSMKEPPPGKSRWMESFR